MRFYMFIKNAVVICLFFLLIGCAKSTDFSLNEYQELVLETDRITDFNSVLIQKYQILNKVSPKSIRKNKCGVYVVTSGFFVEEKGIFIVSNNNISRSCMTSMSGMIKVVDRVYKYHFKG